MWNPEKLILKNFLSHPHSEFIFNKDGLTLIFGKNIDDENDGANSNGSGKSGIIEGITVAITGETYRDIPKDDMIMDDEDEAEVDFYLNNPFLSSSLRIYWRFKRNKAAKVFIYKNGDKEPLKQITSVNEAKKYILEEIGVNREDLLNYFIINQGNSNSFFTSGDAKQKEIIGRFANYQIVDSVISKIESEKSILTEEKREHETQIRSFEGIIQEFESLIEQEKEEAEANVEDEINAFEREIIDLEDEINEKESHIPNKKQLIEDKKKEISEVDSEIKEYETLLSSADELNETVSDLNKKKSKIETEIKKNEMTLGHKIECPKCEHEFILDSELSIEEIHELNRSLKKTVKEHEETIQENKELLKELEKYEEFLSDLKRKRRRLKCDIESIEEEIYDDEHKIRKYTNSVKHIKEQIEQLKQHSEEKTNIPLYESRIKEAEKEKEGVEKLLEKAVKEIAEKDYWLAHLGKKGFQTFLANKCISTVESLCNQFLERMKVNLRVRINGFKVLSSGELRDKIEILITKNGLSEGKFNKYSGGQKERINLAGILTFQRLINNSLNGKGLNLLCLDESLDYLDEKGQKICLDILQMFDVTTMVISHNQVENLIENYNTILVEYKNGKSSISLSNKKRCEKGN